MARPKKAATARRTMPVLVKLTTAEHDRLAAEVMRLCVPMACLVRERALHGTVTVRAAQELAGIDRAALSRVGNNLNQIARVLNEQGGAAIVALAEEVSVTLAQLNAVLLRGADDGA